LEVKFDEGFKTATKDFYDYLFSSRLSQSTTEKESLPPDQGNEVLLARSTSQDFSVKTLRDLENHYQKGIGIRIGPAVEISKGMYKAGNGGIDIAGCVLADFILSPSFSLEPGTKFVKRIYEVSGEDLSKIKPEYVNDTLGTFETMDVDSWVFEIPINLKNRYPLSNKTHWLSGIGYTSLIYTKQFLEHSYSIDSNHDASIVSSYQDSRTRVYPGTLNFSFGISNQLKNKKILETSNYYQKGLGKTGIEENTMNFLGV
jgi:hypothetical protein